MDVVSFIPRARALSSHWTELGVGLDNVVKKLLLTPETNGDLSIIQLVA
jgi:hypothetical protein